jgi:hypothetical protein
VGLGGSGGVDDQGQWLVDVVAWIEGRRAHYGRPGVSVMVNSIDARVPLDVACHIHSFFNFDAWAGLRGIT